MSRSQFTFKTSDNKTINVYRWQPETELPIRGIIQLSHGMAEHIKRYDAFSRFLTENGFVVYGNDHRGHGLSVTAPDDRGYFADENGFEKVVDDMFRLSAIAKNEHPNIPIFIFGHSMGSFLTRRYIVKYGKHIDGAVLSGTGGDQGITGKIGYLLAKIEKRRIGARTPSKLLDKLIFGNFNKSIDNPRTSFDFLTRDKIAVDNYIHDEICGFIESAGFYADLLYGINLIHENKQVERILKALPIFLISGNEDPVGDHGKGVQNVYEQYKQHQLFDVSMKLYEGSRHELLHEWNKDEVYHDVLTWIEERV